MINLYTLVYPFFSSLPEVDSKIIGFTRHSEKISTLFTSKLILDLDWSPNFVPAWPTKKFYETLFIYFADFVKKLKTNENFTGNWQENKCKLENGVTVT